MTKRARMQRVTARAHDIERVREMLTGQYAPAVGDFTPPFRGGTTRHAAFERAVKTTESAVPVILQKSLAGLDFANITWSDPDPLRYKEAVDEALGELKLPRIARDLANEYKITGAAVAMASTPEDAAGNERDSIVQVLRGVHSPYTDPRDPARVTGWYRAVQYIDDTRDGELRWWVEVYDWEDADEGEAIVHRVWKSLRTPTELGTAPAEEFQSIARPRYVLAGMTPDGLPASPILANLGRILGLYATELRLATAEELAAFPMFVTRGEAEFAGVGPAETIAVAEGGDARWLDPGELGQLRDQVMLKRDILREAFNLPGGSLGGQTPSGEALQEANRGFIQETRSTADAISGVLTEAVSDYLDLRGLPGVEVQLPVDRSYTTDRLLEVVEKGVDLGALPMSVTARMFQQFLGSHYSDGELIEFLEEQKARSAIPPAAGFLNPLDDPAGEPDES